MASPAIPAMARCGCLDGRQGAAAVIGHSAQGPSLFVSANVPTVATVSKTMTPVTVSFGARFRVDRCGSYPPAIRSLSRVPRCPG